MSEPKLLTMVFEDGDEATFEVVDKEVRAATTKAGVEWSPGVNNGGVGAEEAAVRLALEYTASNFKRVVRATYSDPDVLKEVRRMSFLFTGMHYAGPRVEHSLEICFPQIEERAPVPPYPPGTPNELMPSYCRQILPPQPVSPEPVLAEDPLLRRLPTMPVRLPGPLSWRARYVIGTVAEDGVTPQFTRMGFKLEPYAVNADKLLGYSKLVEDPNLEDTSSDGKPTDPGRDGAPPA